MSTTATTTSTQLPTGTWTVDPQTSRVGFAARGMFGLARVRGSFGAYEGTLQVEEHRAQGHLRIDAASLDTKNKKRDEHLRSPDFFDVEHAPTVLFELQDIATDPDGQSQLSGVLQIRDTKLPVQAPVTATVLDADRLRLDTTLTVDRAAAGVGWSKMGMIKGPAHLDVSVTLTRA